MKLLRNDLDLGIKETFLLSNNTVLYTIKIAGCEYDKFIQIDLIDV